MPQSAVQIKLDRSGLVTVFCGAIEIGQGSDSVLAAVVAEELGLEPRDIRLCVADTDLTPVDLGSYSSRVTLMVGRAAQQLAGFASLRRELPNVKIRNAKDAKTMAELTVQLAEAATVMKERGLAGALPLLEGPYTAAQLANGGNDPIAKALEGLLLEPPDST